MRWEILCLCKIFEILLLMYSAKNSRTKPLVLEMGASSFLINFPEGPFPNSSRIKCQYYIRCGYTGHFLTWEIALIPCETAFSSVTDVSRVRYLWICCS